MPRVDSGLQGQSLSVKCPHRKSHLPSGKPHWFHQTMSGYRRKQCFPESAEKIAFIS
jgi:hypothetical protein